MLCLLLKSLSGYSQKIQLDELMGDFKDFSYEKVKKIETAEELPPDLLTSFKKILPNKKFTPLLSNNEWVISLKDAEKQREKSKDNNGSHKFKKSKRERIFEAAYAYKDYFIIDYYFTGRYRIERIAIVHWRENKIVNIFLVPWDDLTDPENFKLKKYNRRIYVGKLIVDPDVW
jgi:hypothetical protein